MKRRKVFRTTLSLTRNQLFAIRWAFQDTASCHYDKETKKARANINKRVVSTLLKKGHYLGAQPYDDV